MKDENLCYAAFKEGIVASTIKPPIITFRIYLTSFPQAESTQGLKNVPYYFALWYLMAYKASRLTMTTVYTF